jgi:hypothetical protein
MDSKKISICQAGRLTYLTLSLYIISCGLAIIVPLVVATPDFKPDFVSFSGWPKQFEDRPLMELPLSKRERRFNNDFPGRVARFTDGTREFVIRWVIRETRKLHPGAHCFKGIGYFIKPISFRTDINGYSWGCFEATRDKEKLRVCERIYDEAGNSWTDISDWYWAAFLRRTQGPWWVITVAENLQE